MITLDTLPQDVLLHLWTYLVKNGDSKTVSFVCRTLANVNFTFIERNRNRIVTILEKSDSLLCRGMRYLAKREVTTLQGFYKFNAAIRSFIIKNGCPCPSNRLLLSEDIQLCNETLERMKEDETLETIWPVFLYTLYELNPNNLELRGPQMLVLKAQAIRDWMLTHTDLLQPVIRLNLSVLKLTCLPKEIEQFVNLRTLMLIGNRFTRICPVLQRLGNLERLELSCNPFLEYPPTIGHLTHLGNGKYLNPQAL